MQTTIRLVQSSEIERYADMLHAASGDAPNADAIIQQDARAAARGERRERYVVYSDDEPTGFAAIVGSPFVPFGSVDMKLGVIPSWRRRNIGTTVLELLTAQARDAGYRELVANVPEGNEAALKFAQKNGFTFWHDRFALELDLTTMHPSPTPLINSVEVGPLQDGQGKRAEIAALLGELVSTSPDMKGLPPWDIQAAELFLFDNPMVRPEWIIVAREDGRLVGLTIVSRHQDRAYAFFTGIKPSHRRRGLGRALKIAAIAAAQQAGFRRLFTNNLSTNEAMLALNRSLGFVRKPGFHVMRLRLG